MTDKPAIRFQRLADRLLRNRNVLLLGILAMTFLAWLPASRLTFNQSIESLYADEDPHLRDYLESKSLFGGDEFVMVAYRDPHLLAEEGLALIRRFADELSQVPGVQPESTQDLANARAPKQLTFLQKMLLSTRSREMQELSEGVLIGGDEETTGIVLRLAPEQNAPVKRSETFRRIRNLADRNMRELTGDENARGYVVGEPVQVLDMFEIVETDGSKLFIWSLCLLALVIVLLFRSLRWVLLPLSVVIVAIILTRAVLVLSGMRLSMVSSMLNSLLTIIGIATVMHVTLHYREKRVALDRIEALRKTFLDLAPAIFWTCATTAVGFAALLSSQITPVHSFGTMMALGTLMVLFSTAAILPGGILVGRYQLDPGIAPAEKQLISFLGKITGWVQQHPALLGWSATGLMVITALGFIRLDVETDFSKNFRESSPIVTSLNFVETNLGGAGTWEVNFPAPEVLTPEFIAKVRNFADQLRRLERDGVVQLTKVVAITDILDLLPGVKDTAERIRNKLDQIAEFQPEYEPSLYSAQQKRMRLVLRAKERQPSETKLALISDVEQRAREEFGAAQTTGLFVLLAFLIESLLRDQLVSFALASVGIGVMMTFAFGNWRIGLISLVPNLFPIVLLIGGMGWLGMPINIGTAMIASVSMGLNIDSSIHYIFAYRRLRRDKGPDEALRETHQGVGRALVFSTLALIVGFSVLTISNFIPLVYFGMLVSVAMLGGLIGDLTLLPLLLRWAERE